MTTITMPKLSDSMEQGTILTWLIDDGQPVARGDELVEIETDKATQTCEAEADGTLRILAPAGSTVTVGETIAEIGGPAAMTAEPAARERQAVAPSASAATGVPPSPAPSTGPAGNGSAAVAEGQLATPLARRFARAHDVALAEVAGTGPRGRISRADVLRKIGQPVPVARSVEAASASSRSAGATPASVAGPTPAPVPDGVTVQEPTRLQQTIARRMVESKSTIPEFQVQTEVAMDEAIALRARLKELAGGGGVVPSFNDLVVKAAAVALRRHPLANGSYRNERFELQAHVNVGIAVAVDGALIVPTIRDADVKSVGQIASEARALAGRVRDGRSTVEDLSGGTFTVSNLGMFGMTAITPVINGPQAAILGVGVMREVLQRVDGEIVDRTLMTLTLSCDHRILYGADAARFLAEIKQLIEAPLAMAL
ncbi:dihydrolipoamide acetyltransferase family protein [Conexibacter woesei]|uniref:Dihydrolipoamide acetyltransferase component of pyruvate dehydrogenase complex n=1 Tax=Conexibacter woesei (strain DSM 14684 / CCUG 47730 / CIP 108061 / JCM 11494 / NBRC 100937 / ID131577) TaxID=469383 RepID=D3F9D9_CONWI|nr:dihydrolipoamide acetyltransferase family protein [Conexibacter woesei]ADB49106.1 catalytic domain of components of various dehydrogenase complexes [Conexibacter woesei DSM 14684]